MRNNARPHKTTEVSLTLAGNDIKYIALSTYALDIACLGCTRQIAQTEFSSNLTETQNRPEKQIGQNSPISPQLFSGQHAQMMQNIHEYLRRSHSIPLYQQSHAVLILCKKSIFHRC